MGRDVTPDGRELKYMTRNPITASGPRRESMLLNVSDLINAVTGRPL